MGRPRKIESPSIGHNSGMTDEDRNKLSGFVQEIERVDAEVRELTAERGTIYKAAKKQGFDTKALKEVVRQRRMEREAREAFVNAVDAYKQSLGMLSDKPLGEAAIRAATNGTGKAKRPRKGEQPTGEAGQGPGGADIDPADDQIRVAEPAEA